MTKAVEPAEGARQRSRFGGVDSSTRVLVAFPFSMIRIDESHGAAQVAELLARVCRTLADGGSPEELGNLAAEAEELARRLNRH